MLLLLCVCVCSVWLFTYLFVIVTAGLRLRQQGETDRLEPLSALCPSIFPPHVTLVCSLCGCCVRAVPSSPQHT